MAIITIDTEKLQELTNGFAASVTRPCYKKPCIFIDTLDINCDNCSATLLASYLPRAVNLSRIKIPETILQPEDKLTQIPQETPETPMETETFWDLEDLD